MSEYNIAVEGGKSVRLKTAGKYCDRDIVVTAEGVTLPELTNPAAAEQIVEGYEAINSNGAVIAGANPYEKNATDAEVQTQSEQIGDNARLIGQIKSVLASKAAGSPEVEDALITHTIAEYFNDRVTTIGYGAFYESKNLTKISLPNVTRVGGYAFYKCTSLTAIDLPLLTSADTQAFAYITLPEIYFPSLKTIGTFTFGYSSVPHTIHLPSLTSASNSSMRDNKGVTRVELDVCSKIDLLAFYGCASLETLILRKSDAICTLANVSAFTGTKINKGTGYIYVPRALLSDDDETKDYRRATNWSTYATQFRALEDYTVDGTITGALDESKIAA